MCEILKISDGNALYTLDYSSGESETIPLTSNISPENEAGIPDIDTLIEAVGAFASAEESTSAENSMGVADTVLKLLPTEKGNVYYISYTYPNVNLSEEYYVSLDDRIIIFANIKQNGQNVYSYEVLGFSTDSKSYSDDSLYQISKAD